MPWLLLKLLGFGRWLGKGLGLIVRYPWQTACLLLALLALWFWHSDNRLTEQRDSARAELKVSREGRASDQASYRAAQVQAKAAETARNHAMEAAAAQAIKNEANHYETLLANDRADFARRLRDAERATCTFGSPGSEPTASLPVLSRGTVQTGGDAVISVRDAQIGLDNSRRLAALIAAWGAAKAASDKALADWLAGQPLR